MPNQARPPPSEYVSVALETAQHRPRGAGRKAGRRDARNAGQHFADLPVEIALQILAFQNRGAGEHVEALQAAGGDDDHVVVKVVVVTGRFGRLLGRGLGDRGSGTEDERAQRC